MTATALNSVYPSEAEFTALAGKYPVVPVYMDVLADTETPISVYQKLVGDGEGFLLESVEGGARLGRYSFIGCGALLRVQASGDAAAVTGADNVTAAVTAAVSAAASGQAAGGQVGSGEAENVFRAIQAAVAACQMPALPKLPRFAGGLTGYIGFEASRHVYDMPAADGRTGLPEADLIAPELLVAFDHIRRQVQLIAPAFIGTDPAAAYAQAQARLQQAASALAAPLAAAALAPVAATRPGSATEPEPGRAVPSDSRAEFEAKVRHVQQLIAAGEAEQIVISLRLVAPFAGDGFDVYRRLRSLNPSPYMFYFNLGGVRLAGASPEMLIRVDDGIVEARPIAGTRPRGATAADDERLAADLLQDRKERAEHAMLVDLAQEEVGRVSEPGTVKVENFMHVEHYSHVMHLVSDVKGKLRPGADAVDALMASFPAGTVSGAPKQRALQAVAELEPERGVYAGAVGYFGFQGSMDTCIAIRTIVFRDGEAWVQAGAGIVADSVPAKEYEECLHKARALLQALGVELAATDEHAAADAQSAAVSEVTA